MTHLANLSMFHDFCNQPVKSDLIKTDFYRYRFFDRLTALRDKQHNGQSLQYLGAGAGPFIALVAQVQVEEDIAVLNPSYDI